VNSAPLSDGSLPVDLVRIGSYENEWIEVRPGSPYTISVIGRLSLFSSYALGKAWNVVPAPWRVLFEFRETTEIDESGCSELLKLIGRIESRARFAISLEDLSPKQIALFPKSPGVYPDRAAALAALAELSDTPPWTTLTERS
jgi:hypothetical protein